MISLTKCKVEVACALPFLVLALIGPASGQTTERVSVATDGTQGNGGSSQPSISADGRYVAFYSSANNLVSRDSNVRSDIFVHNRSTGVTKRVSVATDGTQGNGSSFQLAISADGRYVAFDSYAKNLVSGDSNGAPDVFVHDRSTGVTTRVSIATDGTQGKDSSSSPSISADGRYVAFTSYSSNLVPGDSNGMDDVFVHDRTTGVTKRVSVATSGTQGYSTSYEPSISADGRYVAFASNAKNLVSGDSNGAYDVFVHDRSTGETKRVSVATGGTQGNGNSALPSISADGRYVAFMSSAKNLVSGDTNGTYDVFVHDRSTGVTKRVSLQADGAQTRKASYGTSISGRGRYVAFYSEGGKLVTGDTNGQGDVFVRDRGP